MECHHQNIYLMSNLFVYDLKQIELNKVLTMLN